MFGGVHVDEKMIEPSSLAKLDELRVTSYELRVNARIY